MGDSLRLADLCGRLDHGSHGRRFARGKRSA